MLERFLPFLDLRDIDSSDLAQDVFAAVAVTFLAVPQGIAYAMIAGMPPALGLYASAIPTIVGSFFRSSHHVVSGPSNALSLLVGGAIAAQTGDPVVAGVTIAFMVGLLQTAAGVLRLGAIVDYISSAVVLGYITGAGVLIGVGQLGNVTRTDKGSGHIFERLAEWAMGLGDAHLGSIALAAASAVLVLAMRRLTPHIPGTIVAMAGGIALAWGLDLGPADMTLVRDLSPVPAGLPPFTVPDLTQLGVLFPAALAATLLSLVESSSVARNIASRTGQRLDTSTDFYGQGLSNLSAAFSGGFPVSGSLSRSAMNERVGARTRLAGTLSGLLMILVLVAFGPLVDWTPVPVLAGILVVVAINLVDLQKIREVFKAGLGDKLAFVTTLLGTWLLSLDQAILLGVGISIVLFLRRVRHLIVHELRVDRNGRLREIDDSCTFSASDDVLVLHVEGNLFFGAANELQRELEDFIRDSQARVVVVRLKRTQGLDLTTAATLLALEEALRDRGRRMLLVGMRSKDMGLLERTGIADEIGEADLFPTQPGWFAAMDDALDRALTLTAADDDDPLRLYLQRRRARATLPDTAEG